ncbi:DUF4395 family protein [Mesobacillus foraminis]
MWQVDFPAIDMRRQGYYVRFIVPFFDGSQRKWSFCLGAGFFSFAWGWTAAGYVFTIIVALAAFIAILGFCIGCFLLFQWKQYTYRRSHR